MPELKSSRLSPATGPTAPTEKLPTSDPTVVNANGGELDTAHGLLDGAEPLVSAETRKDPKAFHSN